MWKSVCFGIFSSVVDLAKLQCERGQPGLLGRDAGVLGGDPRKLGRVLLPLLLDGLGLLVGDDGLARLLDLPVAVGDHLEEGLVPGLGLGHGRRVLGQGAGDAIGDVEALVVSNVSDLEVNFLGYYVISSNLEKEMNFLLQLHQPTFCHFQLGSR